MATMAHGNHRGHGHGASKAAEKELLDHPWMRGICAEMIAQDLVQRKRDTVFWRDLHNIREVAVPKAANSLLSKDRTERRANIWVCASRQNRAEPVLLIDLPGESGGATESDNATLTAAAETQIGINEKREQFRPVAARGSIMYFNMVSPLALH